MRGQTKDGVWDLPTDGESSSLQHGYSSSQSYTNGNPQSEGEALRSIGALSAPPPPGFIGGNTTRTGTTEGQIWSPKPSVEQSKGAIGGTRTNSYIDLAAAVGSNLAETMDNALLSDSFLNQANPKGEESYARHLRHAASRLPRNLPTRESYSSSHQTSDAGDIFANFNSGERSIPQKGPSHPSYATAFSLAPPQNDDDGTLELQREMKNLWQQDKNETPRRSDESIASIGAGSSVKGSVSSSIVTDGDIQRDAEEELRAFTWDVRHHECSRTLAIMRASSVSTQDVRGICESFGALETFRSDFSERGIFFVSYYDMRYAQFAAMQLQAKLQRLNVGGDKVLVQFCVPLNSSSQNDESLVVLSDVPSHLDIDTLGHMLSSFGAVRSLKSQGGNYGGSSFVVEFHDVQDAKQAVLELESTQPWGPDVCVETGARNPSDRKRGRELLGLLARWRRGGSFGNKRNSSLEPGIHSTDPHRTQYISSPPASRYESYRGGPPQETTHVAVGPDGRYHSYVVVNHSGYPPYGGPPPHRNEHIVQSSHGTYVTHVAPSSSHYWSGAPPQQHHFSGGNSVVSSSSSHYSGRLPSGSRSVPYYPDASSVGSHSHNVRSVPESGTPRTHDDKDNRHLRLDFDAVENGRDSRTSLMVRNIPNKYTQQMLLSEFAEHGHGPGVIDFFYLPIDFKNKCNRGYAFINFVDYRDILEFHRRYYGKHWRTFNSDKICEITYARIQGKAAMLKRFENSALMEKDEEYKPLVFVSNGPDKGTRLPFPGPDSSIRG